MTLSRGVKSYSKLAIKVTHLIHFEAYRIHCRSDYIVLDVQYIKGAIRLALFLDHF